VVNDVLDGKYRLLRPLKRGSMGAVFAAENQRLGMPVAVKVIRADVQPAARAELAQRIILEASVAFRVDHPAIVRVLDVGATPQGDPYLVMELLRGETLDAAFSTHGPVAPVQAVRVLLPIAHALVTAHACNIIHRDIKPHNVFLARTSDGRVQPKLIDFGLARAPQPSESRITQVGNTMGSPAYMSPEQIRGEDVTGQADIWSFCVTLYELIAGEQPFQATTLEVLFTCILFDPPAALLELDPRTESLWPIIEKGLRKDLAERWSSMRELGRALASWLVAQGYHDDICNASVESMWMRPDTTRPGSVFDGLPPPGRRLPSYTDLVPTRDRTPRSRTRWVGRVLFALLWVVVLLGILSAVTGYLQIPIPGLPTHWLRGLVGESAK
jgi:serine/threonine protein kinase